MSGCFLKNLPKDFENSSANRSRGPTCTWQITFSTIVFSNMSGCSERNLPKDFGISSARCNMHSDSDSDSNSDSDSDCDYYDYYELTPATTITTTTTTTTTAATTTNLALRLLLLRLISEKIIFDNCVFKHVWVLLENTYHKNWTFHRQPNWGWQHAPGR